MSSKLVDIVLTGCEVSLWIAEQFATDLQKAFPKVRTSCCSSNKLLGLSGQDVAVPSFGFPHSTKTHDFHNTIVIIVSTRYVFFLCPCHQSLTHVQWWNICTIVLFGFATKHNKEHLHRDLRVGHASRKATEADG